MIQTILLFSPSESEATSLVYKPTFSQAAQFLLSYRQHVTRIGVVYSMSTISEHTTRHRILPYGTRDLQVEGSARRRIEIYYMPDFGVWFDARFYVELRSSNEPF